MAEWMLDEPDHLQRSLDQDREAEAAREVRWAEFIDWLKGDRPKSESEWATCVDQIEQMMRGQHDPAYVHESAQLAICHFQRHENWSGTFSALARALKEQGL